MSDNLLTHFFRHSRGELPRKNGVSAGHRNEQVLDKPHEQNVDSIRNHKHTGNRGGIKASLIPT